MLKSAEYAAIKADYDEISRTHFAESYFYPEGMSFANSDASSPRRNWPRSLGPNMRHNARCSVMGPIHHGPRSSRAFWRFESCCSLPCNKPSRHQWKLVLVEPSHDVSESGPSRTNRVAPDRLILNLSDHGRILAKKEGLLKSASSCRQRQERNVR
jgi:hypothetical protein